MKKQILVLGLILSAVIAQAKEEHAVLGPYIYTLYVEVGDAQPVGIGKGGRIVKTYSGLGQTELDGYYAAKQACLSDGNSEKACASAWVEERHQEGVERIQRGL